MRPPTPTPLPRERGRGLRRSAVQLGTWALALIVLGCGAAPKRVVPTPEPPEKEPEKITAIAPEITVNDKDGAKSFVVRSATTQLEIQEAEGSSARLDAITGEIFKEGKVASRVKADTAWVDQSKKVLTAFGNVRVTDLGGRLVLTARRMVYAEGRQRIEAEGEVTVSSDSLTLGPVPRLWANKKLTRFGTPDRF